ncbi:MULTISPECIES: XTP/dITP diphosphatase [Virgibacillus]|uniref:dITP/XTP pyrophosphatase n=1 Tax=Virgibacillus dokdonensis TaxID=302167 RepID=A0ABU7VHB9_9BACI|nr:XTP/dITP diphosphatase [Virgibacillus sp.]NWO13666.1 XTP/dITP diphosphatase [Virgibacillus sp.]
MKKIIIATKNKGKAKEFKELFAAYELEAISLNELDGIPDVEETGSTFKENAALKVEQIASVLSLPVIADDSGLMIDALDGKPGVYSARYAGEDKSDQANIDKVLTELHNVPEVKRTAHFICVLAVAIPGSATTYYTGYCHGRIAHSPIGKNGFGYDPIFIPKGFQQTMAQLSQEEKNAISHRRNALKELEVSLNKQDILLDR